MDLNDLLDRSAPRVAPRSPALTRELDDLVVGAEATARSTGRRRRAGLVGALTAGVLGLGTAGAMATGVVSTPGWIPWTTGSGATCQMEFDAVPELGPGIESPSRTYTAAEERQAVAEANRFLDELDYRTIDADEAIEKWRHLERVVRDDTDPELAERHGAVEESSLEIASIGHEVSDRVTKHLEAEGLASEAVAVEQGWRCSP